MSVGVMTSECSVLAVVHSVLVVNQLSISVGMTRLMSGFVATKVDEDWKLVGQLPYYPACFEKAGYVRTVDHACHRWDRRRVQVERQLVCFCLGLSFGRQE